MSFAKLLELLARLLSALRETPTIDRPAPPPHNAPPPATPSQPDIPHTPATAMLSPHFSLAELTASDTARRLGIDNSPPIDVVHKLRRAAHGMERVRALLGNFPIIITSGYRAPALNAAIGGSQNSAHMQGYAIDFKCPAFGSPLQIALTIAASEIYQDVDQLIHEYGTWVHISFDPRKRGQLLTIAHGKTAQGLHTVGA